MSNWTKEKKITLIIDVVVLAVAVAFLAILLTLIINGIASPLASLVGIILVILIIVHGYFLFLRFKKCYKLEKFNQKRESFYNGIPGGIFCCEADDKWKISYANAGFYTSIGYTPEEFKEKFNNELYRIVYSEDYEQIVENMNKQLENGCHAVNENRIICKDGTIHWVLVNSQLVVEQSGKRNLYCNFVDNTKSKEVQTELKISQEHYAILMEEIQDIIFEWDIITKEMHCSEHFYKKLGYEPRTHNFPQGFVDQKIIHENDVEAFLSICKRIENGQRYVQGEFRIYNSLEEILWFKVRITTIFNEEGHPYRGIGLFSDISDEKNTVAQIQEVARRDSLTQLYNKGTTEKLISDYLNDSENQFGAMMVIDVDNFKRVNDSLGHIYGDAVLSEIARGLKKLFRGSDVIGRIGGDEFVIFIKDLRYEYILNQKAQEVTEVFHRSYTGENGDYDISGSVGVSYFPIDGKTFNELFKKADLALYYAKKHGKNQFAIYNEQMLGSSIMKSNNSEETLTVLRGDENMELMHHTFRENIAEYLFQILYQYSDLDNAIPVILDLIGKSFEIRRIFVVEKEDKKNTYVDRFEWCNMDVESFDRKFEEYTPSEWESDRKNFDECGVLFCENMEDRQKYQKLSQHVALDAFAFLLCTIEEDANLNILVGFEYSSRRKADFEEIKAAMLLTKIISIYRDKKKSHRIAKERVKDFEQMFQLFDTSIYIIDQKTYKILFINEETARIFPEANIGQLCYKTIRGENKPCADCPLLKMSENEKNHMTQIYNKKIGKWMSINRSVIEWIGGEKACLFACNALNDEQEIDKKIN